MKVKIKTSEIEMEFDHPKYSSEYRKDSIDHLKEIINAISTETIKIKNR